ncbi:MAG: formylglycine-generating enzyme family protein [Acidobacteriota bacterium]|nr:formylglycine-generating enzyme family protein [Acidobacteriota bacterium]
MRKLPAALLLIGMWAGLAGAGYAQTAGPDWVPHPQKPFSIHATEVTVEQYRACVEAGGCAEPIEGARCNDSRGLADHPVNCVAYDDAERYCTWAGGRICREQEWLDACKGTDGRQFPYGTVFDFYACNSQSPVQTEEDRAVDTVAVGSMPQCEGGLAGLFDMSGNVAEWLAGCKDDYCKFRGGGYLSNEPLAQFNGCGGVCSGNARTFRSGVVGIRCCRDRD